MLVKELIKTVALLVGDVNLNNYIDTKLGSEQSANEYQCLITMVNLVVNETMGFIPLVTEEEISVADGKVYYKDLQKKAIQINQITNELGEKLSFTQKLDYVEVDKSAKIINYIYAPETLTEESEIPYQEKDISSSVIAYGVTANYCIYQNRFDEATLWNERYVLGVKEFSSKKTTETNAVKNSVIKGRAFL